MKKIDNGTWLLIGCVVFALIILAAWIFQLVTLKNPFE